MLLHFQQMRLIALEMTHWGIFFSMDISLEWMLGGKP